MMTDIKLPSLSSRPPSGHLRYTRKEILEYALSAVEADRQERFMINQLQRMADVAYIQYIQQMSSLECLGWEQKVKVGKFTESELKAHTKAGEFLGRHRAFSECIEILLSSK